LRITSTRAIVNRSGAVAGPATPAIRTSGGIPSTSAQPADATTSA
jgi:hypothetical protein